MLTEAKSIKIKQTRKVHKESGWNRFLVKTDDYKTDTPDIIHIQMGNGVPTLKMEIVDGEISLWVNKSDGYLKLRTPVYDTAIIDLERKHDENRRRNKG